MPDTLDSNLTGLRYAEEVIGTPGVLPGSPVWNPLEPNEYGDFGGEVTTRARATINPSRQRKKGSVVDLDAMANITHDFTQNALYDMMQGYFFADWREKANTEPTAVTATGYTVADESPYAAGYLILAEGFGLAANNGLKQVTGTIAGEVQAAGLSAEGSPPAGAKITVVGVVGAAGDIDVDAAGANPALTSTVLDFTTLGLIPGEWIFIGGDAAGTFFPGNPTVNNGFVRILSIAAGRLEFDRTPGTMVTEASTTETIQLFFAHVIKNENTTALIKKRTYQFERQLDTAQFEYIPGATPNTLEFRVVSADKITVNLGFMGLNNETAVAAKGGTRPSLVNEEAFNSSADFTRLRMLNDSAAVTLFTYLTDLTLRINNNLQANKAVTVLGSLSITAGDFVAEGSLEAYFSTIDAVDAVKNNDDVSLDFALVRTNAGWIFDVPLITLGDGRANIQKDQPIKLPLSMEGAAHPTLDHSMLAQSFTYLPTRAE